MDGSNSAVIDAISSRKALPTAKRQYRSAELKRQIVEETLAPGASVARVARAKAPQHLCADAGYKGAPARQAVRLRHYRPHIKQRREEAEAKRKRPGYKARRWVVERTHSWLNRFRKLLVSFEKTKEGYVALLALAAAMICWRQDNYYLRISF